MKKLISLCLMLCLLVGLCACGDSEPVETPTETPTEAPATEVPTEAPTEAAAGYVVKVVDEGGNPIAGALVQLCAETCLPAVTDAEGVANFANAEIRDDYKISFVTLPAGYDYVDDVQEFHFAEGEMEYTITLKAVA